MTEPAVVETVAERARETARDFARTPVSRKLAALHEVRARLGARGHELARLGATAKDIAERQGRFGEELLAGAVIIQRYVRLLAESLEQIRERGAPLIGDERVQRLANGEVSARVMPHSLADRALFMPYAIDVRLAAHVDAADVRSAQASFYRESAPQGSVVAVMGGGNVASIPALDLLHECFVAGLLSEPEFPKISTFSPNLAWCKIGACAVVGAGSKLWALQISTPRGKLLYA